MRQTVDGRPTCLSLKARSWSTRQDRQPSQEEEVEEQQGAALRSRRTIRSVWQSRSASLSFSLCQSAALTDSDARSSQNPWQSWFADVELRKVIRQDVERT